MKKTAAGGRVRGMAGDALRACRRALELVKQLKLIQVIVDLDNNTVVSKLNSLEVDR
jgi:hypothetical protein